jgi:hypothetical protein
MFDVTECILLHELTTYKCTIIHAKFVHKYIATITSNKALVYVVFSENETNPENVFQMSFRVAPTVLQTAKQLLFSTLSYFTIPTPFYIHHPHPTIVPQRIQRLKSNFIHMRTLKHVYRITIKESTYHYYVTIGGKFHKCVELFIYKEGESTLSQVYSEPECTVDSMIHGGGETVDMIKGALQLCQLVFGVNEYMFRDASEIDCDEKDMTKPIGKRITKPFSLTHLSLINKCKTWYEFHFNATIKDPEQQNKYITSRHVFNTPMNISLDTIARDPSVRLTDEQRKELEPYFSPSKTWIQFLRSVPKEKQCELLNWTHNYLDRLMKFRPREHDWVIRIEPVKQLVYPFPKEPAKDTTMKDVCDTEPLPKYMKHTLMIPLGIYYKQGGGGTRKKTRGKSGLVFRHNGTHYQI